MFERKKIQVILLLYVQNGTKHQKSLAISTENLARVPAAYRQFNIASINFVQVMNILNMRRVVVIFLQLRTTNWGSLLKWTHTKQLKRLQKKNKGWSFNNCSTFTNKKNRKNSISGWTENKPGLHFFTTNMIHALITLRHVTINTKLSITWQPTAFLAVADTKALLQKEQPKEN